MGEGRDAGEELSADELPEPIRGILRQLEPRQDHPAYQWFEMSAPGFVVGPAVVEVPGLSGDRQF
jgi:hypothetical protein